MRDALAFSFGGVLTAHGAQRRRRVAEVRTGRVPVALVARDLAEIERDDRQQFLQSVPRGEIARSQEMFPGCSRVAQFVRDATEVDQLVDERGVPAELVLDGHGLLEQVASLFDIATRQSQGTEIADGIGLRGAVPVPGVQVRCPPQVVLSLVETLLPCRNDSQPGQHFAAQAIILRADRQQQRFVQ